MDSNKIKSEQIQKFWDSFGEIFSKSLESNTLQMSYSLISQLNLKESESIFEAGIGGGQTIPIIIAIKKKESIYYGVDLSHNLLQLSAYRISYLQNNSNLNGLNFWTNEPFRSQEKKEDFYSFPYYNITLKQMNCENLETISNDSFDTYFSSSTLHLVSNPQKMISEAYRILKKNGKAGFSVWGDSKISKFFTIVPETIKKFGFSIEEERSPFYLGNKNDLIKMMKNEGFQNIICWNQFFAYDFYDEEEFYENRKSALAKLFNIIDENMKEKIILEIKREFKNIIQEKTPAGLDVLLIIAQK